MSQQYTLKVQNNTRNVGKICVYQTLPDLNDPTVMSLAWFAKVAHPTTHVQFNWNIDYSFIWDETGPLVPGVVFDASQVWPAGLTSNNSVTFSSQQQALTFTNQQTAARAGTLYVHNDGTVPFDKASVGIGMSGAGTFAKPAQPNMTFSFTPHPEYWVTFGDYQVGEVLDIESITNAQKIVFNPNVYNVDAVLNLDNTWTVK
ncbi:MULTISPECIES: protein rhiA [Enterobacterales]|uniref:protein rhiA n=1 Tax=Enterobacterales TaxID=91347 RepID=UPI002ED8EE78